MDTLVFVLLTISIALWLSYPASEPFTDKEPAKATQAKATQAKATQAKATQAKATQAKATQAPAKATQAKGTEPESQPYLQRSFVTIPESTENPRMNCPHNYEIANRELQVQFQDISLGAFGYSKNPYIDLTRFVNFKTIKEPLPVNPDFF
jgi:hypothetical protein